MVAVRAHRRGGQCQLACHDSTLVHAQSVDPVAMVRNSAELVGRVARSRRSARALSRGGDLVARWLPAFGAERDRK